MLSRIAMTYEFKPSHQEELLQDIALAIWRALPSWRGEASVKTFIARVAHNRCVDHVIRQKQCGEHVELPEGLADPSRGPEALVAESDQYGHLLAAIRRLPLNQQQVITLVLEGFPHVEIAATLGISVNNVDVRLTRARQALRQLMGGHS